MEYMKWYAEALRFLIALQNAAPKAIEIIQHMGDDIMELIELTRGLVPDAPQFATEAMPEPTEDVLQLENQLMGLLGEANTAIDFTKLRETIKRLVDSGLAEKLLPFLTMLMSKKTGGVQL